MSEYLIETDKLKKTYRVGEAEIVAVNMIDLKIAKGEFVALMGPSGSGKTTFLNLVSGLEKPTSGKVYFEGNDLTELNEAELTLLRRQKIGFVFQLYNLIPVLTALENVELPTVAAGLPREEGRRKSLKMLERVDLKGRLNHKPSELSGGEQQRVAIARALVNDPTSIIADEPTGSVDTKTGLGLVGLLTELNKERGVTIILATHNQLMAEHADRVIEMRDGKITSNRLNSHRAED